LRKNGRWFEAVGERRLEEVPLADVKTALLGVEHADAEALFWLAFAWGGGAQAGVDPDALLSLPKIEVMIARVLELDETVYYGIGAHLLAGVFYGFRAPALGGDP